MNRMRLGDRQGITLRLNRSHIVDYVKSVPGFGFYHNAHSSGLVQFRARALAKSLGARGHSVPPRATKRLGNAALQRLGDDVGRIDRGRGRACRSRGAQLVVRACRALDASCLGRATRVGSRRAARCAKRSGRPELSRRTDWICARAADSASLSKHCRSKYRRHLCNRAAGARVCESMGQRVRQCRRGGAHQQRERAWRVARRLCAARAPSVAAFAQ